MQIASLAGLMTYYAQAVWCGIWSIFDLEWPTFRNILFITIAFDKPMQHSGVISHQPTETTVSRKIIGAITRPNAKQGGILLAPKRYFDGGHCAITIIIVTEKVLQP